jgi:hypothetical protein
MTLMFSIKPALEIVACSTTVPWVRVALAIAGYWGTVFSSKFPAITPNETDTFFGGAAGATITGPVPVLPITLLMLPGVLLLRPSTTPSIVGGAADSCTSLFTFGILLGASNSVLTIADLMRTLGIAGGGVGTGGATISAAIICLGNASGCSSGHTISAISIPLLRNKATIDQYLLLALILWADSIKESSNIDLLQMELNLHLLRHHSRHFDPELDFTGRESNIFDK